MADSKEKILPQGIRFFNKHDNAPDFVVGSLVISLNALVKFAKENPELLSDYNGDKQIRLQVLTAQSGALYSVVDTYKKGDPKPQAKPTAAKPTTAAQVTEPMDDLPF